VKTKFGCGCGTGLGILILAFVGSLMPKSPTGSHSEEVTASADHKQLPAVSTAFVPFVSGNTTPEASVPSKSKWALPNSGLTPGDIFYVTLEQLAKSGYTRSVRKVSNQVKHQVYESYKISDHSGYVIDHLIPLEIGGSNEVSNLWPQPEAEAHKKDKLEKVLHHLVITRQINLAAAQREIAADWVAAYDKYCNDDSDSAPSDPLTYNDPAPLLLNDTPTPVTKSGVSQQRVWVNTKTGVYHYLGSRWYGHTQQGKYIKESDAITEGDRSSETE
jgi:hypothetical protein